MVLEITICISPPNIVGLLTGLFCELRFSSVRGTRSKENRTAAAAGAAPRPAAPAECCAELALGSAVQVRPRLTSPLTGRLRDYRLYRLRISS